MIESSEAKLESRVAVEVPSPPLTPKRSQAFRAVKDKFLDGSVNSLIRSLRNADELACFAESNAVVESYIDLGGRFRNNTFSEPLQ